MKTFYKLLAFVMIFGLVFAALPSGNARAADAPDVEKPIELAADWLVAEQMPLGGWGSGGEIAPQTVGEIGKGLAVAYNRLGAETHRAALEKAGVYLLNKSNNFSPADGILAYELDQILGVKTYTKFVNTYYFDKLVEGTYNGMDYGAYLPTLTDWLNSNDPALGLISAHLVEADIKPWVEAVNNALSTVDLEGYGFSYPIIAKSFFSLSFVGETFETGELGEALVSSQYPSGGFALGPSWVGEQVAPTAFTILALNQIDRAMYWAKIEAAAAYLLSVQDKDSGYWGFWETGNYNSTALAIWALNEAYPAAVACTTDCYVDVAAGSDTNLGNADSPFATIQKAVATIVAQPTPTAMTTYTITVAEGTYQAGTTIDILQQENKNIVLQSATGAVVTIKDQIRINGNGRSSGTESLTIQGFAFDLTDTIHKDAITTFAVSGVTYNYSHNVYIKNSTFTGDASFTDVAVRAAASGGHYNYVLEGLTATSMHSLAQFTSVSLVTVKDCTVSNGKSGVNLLGSPSLVDNLDYSGISYGVRTDSNLTIKNSSLISSGDANLLTDPNTALVLRNNTIKTITVENSDLQNSVAGNYAISNNVSTTAENSPPEKVTLVITDVDTGNGSFDTDLLGGLGPVTLVHSIDVDTTQYNFFNTIQTAIDAAVDGDTVLVAAGTYAELLTVDKAITLQGPNAAIAGDGTRVEEAVLTFPDGLTGIMQKLITVASDGVTIDGLKFQDKAYIQPYYPLHIYTISANNLTIKNNLFIGGEQPIYRDPYITGFVYTDNTGWLIENNKFVGGPFVNSEYARAMYIYKTGATIQNNVIEGYAVGIQILPATAVVGGVVENNTIAAGHIGLYHNGHDKGAGAWSYSGNTITVAPNNRAENLNIYDPIVVGQAVNFRAIHVINFGNGGTGALPMVTFTDNIADLQPEATSELAGRIAVRVSGTSAAGTIVTFEENAFENYTVAADNVTVTAVDASPNWWGSPCAPAPVIGTATVTPWYIDSSMTTSTDDVATGNYTFTPGMSTAEMNAVIACAAPYTTLTFDGTYPGGLVVPPDRHHLTFVLNDGTVIDSDSFGFNVFGDHIRIQGELGSYGKAVIKPGNGGTGILVNFMPHLYGAPWDQPLVDLVIEGIEIDGSGRSTGQGIWSAYFITDLQILNNYIHDMGAEAILFEDEILNTFEVQGNMFKNNAYGIADLTSHLVDPDLLDLEFNSWGDFEVTNAMATAAGSYVDVDFDPWTHAELFIEHVAGSSPWTDKFFSDDTSTITYAVKASLKESMGAQFDLLIPAGLTVTGTTVNDAVFETQSLIPGTGKLTYMGAQLSTTGASLPITEEQVTLFTVTFKTDAAGTYPLSIDDDSAVFAMLPWEIVGGVRVTTGSSTWVYLDEAHPASITAFEKPTISSTDIDGYYITGIEQEFHVSSTNPLTGGDYSKAMFKITIKNALAADIASLKYWETYPAEPDAYVLLNLVQQGADLVAWWGLADYGGFPMAPGFEDNVSFLVTFANAKNYEVLVELYEMEGGVPGTLLVDETFAASVFQQPAITSPDIQGYYLTGEQREFTVKVNNPLAPAGQPYYPVMFKFTIEDATLADINSAEYFETYDPANTWVTFPLQQVGDDVVGWYGLVNYGGFNLPADALDHPGLLRVDFKKAGVYPVLVELYLMDGEVDPAYVYEDNIVRKVAEKAFTMTAYAKPAITFTDAGGPFVAGVPDAVTLSITDPSAIPEPFELVFTYPAGTVISYGGVDYTCATTCPAIPVDLTANPTALNFTVTLDEAWTGDVNVSLFDSDWTPADRLLAQGSTTGVVVSGGFAVTGTFSMQGRTYRGGIPVTFTWGGLLGSYTPGGPTINQISDNLALTLQYGGDYTITTAQKFYLDVTPALAKKITGLAGARALTRLELKGGDVTDDNVVGLSDGNMVGSHYGSSLPAGLAVADANFSGKVDIFDLTLVGGNWGATSASVYGTWAP